MKAVLISIRPNWCNLIASGKKTVEVRKTRPKIDTPFKVYIYQTRKPVAVSFSGTGRHISEYDKILWYTERSGKVIGEFLCDAVFPISCYYSDTTARGVHSEQPYTCLTDKEMIDYLGNGVDGYGWHISNLVIYDKPKSIVEFCKPCDRDPQCDCNYCKRYGGGKPVLRAPQSWCYVEELQK